MIVKTKNTNTKLPDSDDKFSTFGIQNNSVKEFVNFDFIHKKVIWDYLPICSESRLKT